MAVDFTRVRELVYPGSRKITNYIINRYIIAILQALFERFLISGGVCGPDFVHQGNNPKVTTFYSAQQTNPSFEPDGHAWWMKTKIKGYQKNNYTVVST